MAASSRNVRLYPFQIMYFVEKLRNINNAGLNLVLKSENPNGTGVWFRIHHGATMTSWGEKITVTLTPQGEGTVVDIISECGMPTQIVDWGKNASNVNAVFRYLEAGLPAPTPAQAPVQAPAAAPAQAPELRSAAPQSAETKQCPVCGAVLRADSRFCPRCGAQL